MQNISMFLRVGKELGIPEYLACDTIDLYEEKDIPKFVQYLHVMGGMVQKRGITNVPPFGIAMQDPSPRQFTAENLKDSKMAGTLLTQGSSNVMEKIPISREGIVFGNDYSGSGSTEALTKMAEGSIGMERLVIGDRGITFGTSPF